VPRRSATNMPSFRRAIRLAKTRTQFHLIDQAQSIVQLVKVKTEVFIQRRIMAALEAAIIVCISE
jgi:hypothetical protein